MPSSPLHPPFTPGFASVFIPTSSPFHPIFIPPSRQYPHTPRGLTPAPEGRTRPQKRGVVAHLPFTVTRPLSRLDLLKQFPGATGCAG